MSKNEKLRSNKSQPDLDSLRTPEKKFTGFKED